MKIQQFLKLFRTQGAVLAFFVTGAALLAQSDLAKTPDQRWGELEPRSRDNSPRGAEGEIALADDFRGFYSENPGHSAASKARAYEALSLVKAWKAGDRSQQSRREAAVASVRADTTVPVELRAEVVATAENTAIEQRPFRGHGERIKAFAEGAERISKEFPSWETGFESLIGIARVSEPVDASAILSKVISNANTPQHLKTAAMAEQARLGLIGQNLAQLLRPQDQAALRQLTPNVPVVVYTWSSEDPSSQFMAKSLAERLDPQVQQIGINLENGDQGGGGRGKPNYYDLPGLLLQDDPQMRLSSALHLNQPGMTYLVDSAGVIVAVALTPKAVEDYRLFGSQP